MFLFDIGLLLSIGKLILARNKNTNVATRINIISLSNTIDEYMSWPTAITFTTICLHDDNPSS